MALSAQPRLWYWDAMAPGRIRSVAIAGGGPAGCALATYLARAGLRVGLFAPPRPATLLVGESLVPAVIPFLRDLGVEDEVRSYGTYKPGGTFVSPGTGTIHFVFADARGRVPDYAYNVPRDRFDATLRSVAQGSGARLFSTTARLERGDDAGSDEPTLRLSAQTLEASRDHFEGSPDFIVDASGRRRVAARLLGLPERSGDRRDTALFAHLEGVSIDREGHVHSDRLEHGWCWRIPLPGRVSLGIVVNPRVLSRLGEGSEEQFEGTLRSDPHLKRICDGARRVTPVLKYTNYQLTTLIGVGRGWALAGDSFGFVDPVLSSGLYLAFDGARALARAITRGTPADFRRYQRRQIRHIEAWQRITGYFYDGRLLSLLQMRDRSPENWVGRLIYPHVSKHLPRIFTGEATRGFYSLWLLDFMIAHALGDPDLSGLRIN